MIFYLKAGQGKEGTDESEFIRILCSRSFAQLAAIFENYTNYCKTDILEAIKNELSGNFRLACMTIGKNFNQLSLNIIYFLPIVPNV